MTENTNTYDTIVIGAGMAGGWAAKEFSEQGFKTLLLERGPNVEHLKDYPTTNMQPWEFKHRVTVLYCIFCDMTRAASLVELSICRLPCSLGSK